MMAVEGVIDAQAPQRHVLRDSNFFLPAALIQLLLVLWGFGPTFFLTVGAPAPHPTMLTDKGDAGHALFLAHGLIFTSWMLLYCLQSGLISARRVGLHRRLGLSAAGLLPVIVLLGLAAALYGLHYGFHFPGASAEAFFAVPLISILGFGVFAGVGLLKRRDSVAHKRWMLLATMTMTQAATARIELLGAIFPEWFDVTAFLLPALMLWDVKTRGRVHAVTLWGGIAFLIIDMGSLPIGESSPWLALMAILQG